MSSAPLRERFRSSLLGLAVGVGFGAHYEGLPATNIFHRFGPPDSSRPARPAALR